MVREVAAGSLRFCLGPDRGPVDAVPTSESGDANTVGASCSQSIHFAGGQRCSRPSPRLCRQPDERIIANPLVPRRSADSLVPREDQSFDMRRPVPVALGKAHPMHVVQTLEM